MIVTSNIRGGERTASTFGYPAFAGNGRQVAGARSCPPVHPAFDGIGRMLE